MTRVATSIPARFSYRTYVTNLLAEMRTRGLSPANVADADTARELLEAASRAPWGLEPLGYENGGYNGGPSDNWHLPDTWPYLNIAIAGRYRGRMTIIFDDENSRYAPDAWVDPKTGQAINDRINRNRSHQPGHPAWTAPFSGKAEFLEALRTAHAHMRDPEALTALHALTQMSDGTPA